MISIIIFTNNEEQNLPRCLESVTWSNDIHILDSGSTDKTIDIALQKKVNVSRNALESYGKQRNFALDNLNIKNEWLLFLDADEVSTDEFHRSITELTKCADEDVAGFYCCWKMILQGKWLRRSDNFPKWQFRLMRKGRARFMTFGHGQKETDVKGRIEYIKTPYLHYGFSKGWFNWMERHNRYSSQEAAARLEHCPPFKNIFSRQVSIRNTALKSWLSRFSGWPFLRFFYTYIICLGFLEGGPGFTYCINMSYYEFLIQIKMREVKKPLNLKYTIQAR